MRAAIVLDDPDHCFASSPFLQLETLPKATDHRQLDEQEFYNLFFDSVNTWTNDVYTILKMARNIASSCGITAIDALHIAAVLTIGAVSTRWECCRRFPSAIEIATEARANCICYDAF